MIKINALAFSIALLLSISLNANNLSKVALIVAVGDYPKSSGWTKLNTKNDALLIQSALLKQGFDKKDILVISDEQATRRGIIQAFEDHLINKAQRGGTAVFHFSGHGQQVADNNHDEIDHFDEALVPYDSPMYFKKDVYEGERLIRDEELGRLLVKLRKRLGRKGHVMVLLDACHSGTGTRGQGKARGSGSKMASPDYLENYNNDFTEYNTLSKESHLSGRSANMVSFFASGANELNYESRDRNGLVSGSFSYAFSKVFSSIDNNTSYRGLFDRIKVEMMALAPRQTPQVEGNLDELVLGGKIDGNPKHFKVLKSYDDIVIINGGTLGGLHHNTTLTFYPIDTRDTSIVKPIARGIIQFAELFTSEVQIDRVLSSSEILESWAYIETQNYGDLTIRLQLNFPGHQLYNSFEQKISEYPVIHLVDSLPDLIVNIIDGNNQVVLKTKEAHILLKIPYKSGGTMEKSVVREALQFAQTRFLRNLEIQDPWMNLKLELIPVREKQARENVVIEKLEIKSKTGPDGIVRFQEDDKFKVRITNTGKKAVYYSLLDIQPDNKINLILPEANFNRKAEEYYLLPGQSHELPEQSESLQNYWTFGPPFGNEVFKLIATSKPLDLKNTIATRGASSSAKAKNAHPFEILFGATFKNNAVKTRGTSTPNIPPNAAQVSSFVFKIVE